MIKPDKMKRYRIQSFVAFFLLLTISACESSVTYEEALDRNRQNMKEPEKVKDANFLVKAKSLTTLQISLLQLAQEKGYSSATVNLGKENVPLFKALESDISDLAGKEDIRLADTMDPAHLRLFEEIRSTDRPSFDQKFVFSLKSINVQELKLFEEHAVNSFDPDIRAFAARKLGQFKSQSDALSKVEKDLIPITQ